MGGAKCSAPEELPMAAALEGQGKLAWLLAGWVRGLHALASVEHDGC